MQAYLRSIVPINLVAVVGLGVVRSSDLYPTQAPKHFHCIWLTEASLNTLVMVMNTMSYCVRCGGVSRKKVDFELFVVQKDASS